MSKAILLSRVMDIVNKNKLNHLSDQLSLQFQYLARHRQNKLNIQADNLQTLHMSTVSPGRREPSRNRWCIISIDSIWRMFCRVCRIVLRTSRRRQTSGGLHVYPRHAVIAERQPQTAIDSAVGIVESVSKAALRPAFAEKCHARRSRFVI